jgi:hypothetical protein
LINLKPGKIFKKCQESSSEGEGEIEDTCPIRQLSTAKPARVSAHDAFAATGVS